MQFYGTHYTTRKVLCAFMDFLSNISIQKFKTVNGIIVPHKFVRVPVQYASAEKWLQVLRSASSNKSFDPAILNQNPIEIEWILPRISVNMTSFAYASERHLNKTQRIRDYQENATAKDDKNVFAPVPYNIDVDVVAIARNLNEVLQITEQIIPFFSPSLSLDIRLFADRPTESVPIILSSVSPDIQDEISETDERVFTFTFTFVIKVNYYLPTKIDAKIKNIEINSFDLDTLKKFDQYIIAATQP